jgi:hypothetical protein
MKANKYIKKDKDKMKLESDRLILDKKRALK